MILFVEPNSGFLFISGDTGDVYVSVDLLEMVADLPPVTAQLGTGVIVSLDHLRAGMTPVLPDTELGWGAIITAGLSVPGRVHRPVDTTDYGPVKDPEDLGVEHWANIEASILAAELGLSQPAIVTGPSLPVLTMEGQIYSLTIVGEAEVFRGAGLAFTPIPPILETGGNLSLPLSPVSSQMSPHAPTLESWFRVDLSLNQAEITPHAPSLSTSAEVSVPTLSTEWFPWMPVPNEGAGHDAILLEMEAQLHTPLVEIA